MLHHIIFIAFLFWSAFGFLESFIFLLNENFIQHDLTHTYHMNLALSELIIGGISSSLAFIIATSISRQFRYKVDNKKHIYIDGLGILLGFAAVIFMYCILDIHSKFRTEI